MSLVDETTTSLRRMQLFDASTLVQEAKLGSAKNFKKVVTPATRLVDLYKRLTEHALQDFPEQKLEQVRARADSDFQLFEQVLLFDPDRTSAERDALVASVTSAYGPCFEILHPLVAYSLHRAADFQALDSQARATFRAITDQATALTNDLEGRKTEAVEILAAVRKTAAESGVTQQAIYFKESADAHDSESETWRGRVTNLAWVAGIFAFLSLFLHRIPLLAPQTAYDTVQIGVSKILIFGVLSFLLYLSARNFMSHKHNAVVNRHRHQALLTYQALVAAAADTANRDIVHSHAAACIFGSQPTGYSDEARQSAPSAKSVVELMGSSIARGTGAS